MLNRAPYCRCPVSREGIRCEHIKSEAIQRNDDSSGVALPVLLSIGVLLVIVGGVAVGLYLVRGRETFSHERLRENDFNNPMYQERDAEPFTLDADKVGNPNFSVCSTLFFMFQIYICFPSLI